MKKKLFSILALLCMAVTGAWAQSYVKVTSAPEDWSGDYLIVYENSEGNLAFNGELETLDNANNTIDVTINDGAIAATEATNAAKFTIAAMTGGYSVKAASGKYIGQTSNSNGLISSDEAIINTIVLSGGSVLIGGSAGAVLRFNAASGQMRFRYYKATSYTNQKAVQLYKYTPVGGGTLSDEEFDLTSVANEYGTITFTNADGDEITKAKEGDVVTVTVTSSDDEHVAAHVTGMWYAAIAASRIASTGTSVELLTDIEFTPVEDTYNQWTFVMQRANAEVSASYWDIYDLIELIRKEMNTAVVFLATYGSQMVESDIVPIVLACNEAYDLLERHDNGVDIPLDEALEVYMKLKKLNGMDYGVTTGIGNVNVNVNVNGYYDLSGRRVAQPTKGIYILNGKKMMVK